MLVKLPPYIRSNDILSSERKLAKLPYLGFSRICIKRGLNFARERLRTIADGPGVFKHYFKLYEKCYRQASA
jgi:hypothetical protein